MTIMPSNVNFFTEHGTDTASDSYMWPGGVANFLIEGIWDGASALLQFKKDNEWITYQTFTKDSFYIIENLLPGWQIRFILSDSGLATEITVNMIRG